jgi:hypothetical protein
MLNLFGGKSDHPMADAKAARKVIEQIPAGDAIKALEDLGHWLESVCMPEGFRPDYRAQLVQMIDEAAQIHLRKLQREYLSSSRLSKFQENRLWSALYGAQRQIAIAFATCIDDYATGQKGGDVLKGSMPLLTVRALRALAAQVKWHYVRYGPIDDALWSMACKIYALAEARKFARTRVLAYPGDVGESSPEQEFLKMAMLAASSPDRLLPAEVDLVERLITHFSGGFKLTSEHQPDIAYWIDLAGSQPPQRLARPPQATPTLRFLAAGGALVDLTQLIQSLNSTSVVPSALGLGALGGSYEPEVVLDALNHLALYWSPKPPARRTPRHTVKSRLAATYGLDGVLAALDPARQAAESEESRVESWVVENVSAGGFGASVPQIKGDWLKIGCLVGLQPEGGENWVIGLIRRFSRETPQQGSVGIQTLARTAVPVRVRLQAGQASAGRDARWAVLLNPAESATEAQLLLPPGLFAAGQNLELERNGKSFLLLPSGIVESGEDYEQVRFRQMVRDTDA